MIGIAVELGIGAGSVQRIFLRVAAVGTFIGCLELLETQKSKKQPGTMVSMYGTARKSTVNNCAEVCTEQPRTVKVKFVCDVQDSWEDVHDAWKKGWTSLSTGNSVSIRIDE